MRRLVHLQVSRLFVDQHGWGLIQKRCIATGNDMRMELTLEARRDQFMLQRLVWIGCEYLILLHGWDQLLLGIQFSHCLGRPKNKVPDIPMAILEYSNRHILRLNSTCPDKPWQTMTNWQANWHDKSQLLNVKPLPSGKRLHNYGKIHHFQWENPLFQWWFSIAILS